MSSRSEFYSIQSADKGTDLVGLAQLTGTISAIAPGISPRLNTKLMLTVNSTVGLKSGMPIRIAALDAGHNGLTRILRVVSTTKVIVNILYNAALVDGVGTWSLDGGASAWDAMIPTTADLVGTNLALTFWRNDNQGGNETLPTYTKDQLYIFPGVIKTIQISTAGNVKLIRSSTLRPLGLPAQ
jgi:hypothetical protein